MKKLKFVMAMAIMSSLIVPAVFATSEEPDNTTKITYTQTEATADYTLSIPKDIQLTAGSGVKAAVGLQDVTVSAGYEVTVKMSSANTEADATVWKMANTEKADDKIEYVASKTQETTGAIKNGEVVLTVNSTENTTTMKTQDLYFGLNGVQTKVGTFEDTITFTVEVVESAQQ